MFLIRDLYGMSDGSREFSYRERRFFSRGANEELVADQPSYKRDPNVREKTYDTNSKGQKELVRS